MTGEGLDRKSDIAAELAHRDIQIDQLQSRVAELYDLIKYAQVDSGVCMCGDNMQDHNQASGHSPVDVWDHAVEQVDKSGISEAFILRKQAEAVQASRQALSSCSENPNSSDHASRQGVEGDGVRGYSYELARSIENGKYCDFALHISRQKPSVPVGSIRNLEPLYTHPASADNSKHHAVMQAQMWAQEARTQKAIVKEIGELVGCANDWEMVEAVRNALATLPPKQEQDDE